MSSVTITQQGDFHYILIGSEVWKIYSNLKRAQAEYRRLKQILDK